MVWKIMRRVDFFLFSIMMIIFNLHRDTDTDAHFLFWVENK